MFAVTIRCETKVRDWWEDKRRRKYTWEENTGLGKDFFYSSLYNFNSINFQYFVLIKVDRDALEGSKTEDLC